MLVADRHVVYRYERSIGNLMSNFPLSYRLTWLPRLLKPSLAGAKEGFAPAAGGLMKEPPWSFVRLAFVGDMSAVANRRPPAVDETIREVLRGADLVVGNCETPVVTEPYARLATRLGSRHAMHPALLDGMLAACAIEPARLVLSLANNHALDQGIAGFEETRAALAARGIRTAGAGRRLAIVEAGGLRIGLLAFTEWRNETAANYAGRVTMASDVEDWTGAGPDADMVCALPHWDREFRHFPLPSTRRLARSLVDRGAALIAGHHAHVLQPVERIGDAVVAYGLGDVLGTAFPRQPWPARIGAILVADVSVDPATQGRLASYRLVPFVRMRRDGNERLADAWAAAAVEPRIGMRLEAILRPCRGSGR